MDLVTATCDGCHEVAVNPPTPTAQHHPMARWGTPPTGEKAAGAAGRTRFGATLKA